MLSSSFIDYSRRISLVELISISINFSKYSLVRKIIELFIEKGVDLTQSIVEKLLIYLALDNSSSTIEALLCILYRRIDEDFNLYYTNAY